MTRRTQGENRIRAELSRASKPKCHWCERHTNRRCHACQRACCKDHSRGPPNGGGGTDWWECMECDPAPEKRYEMEST